MYACKKIKRNERKSREIKGNQRKPDKELANAHA